MIILRVSPGIANSMLEYAAAYELAKECGTELIIDISEHENSIMPFMLDYFNIPDLIKISYPVEINKGGHGRCNSIQHVLSKKTPVVLIQSEESENDNFNTYLYTGIADSNVIEMGKKQDLYLNGYFFDRKFHDKYWDEVTRQFVPKENFREIRAFETYIEGKTSIAVHVRRGDMLFAEWALEMEDNYYLGAVEWFRRHYKGCVFFIFSDDKKYVRELFGSSDDVKYVDMLGFDEADLLEFVCISRCTHRILSNSSTYGRLADDLNAGLKKITVRKCGGEPLSGILYRWKLFFMHSIFGEKYMPSKYDFGMSPGLIDRYSRQYKKRLQRNKNKEQPRSFDFSDINICKDNADAIMDQIACCSIGLYPVKEEFRNVLLKAKMECLYYLQRYDRFIELSYSLYSSAADEEWFRRELIDALTEEGYQKEAQLEQCRNNSNKGTCICVFADNQGNIYSRNTMEMQYADTFGHLGFNVHLFLGGADKTSQAYVEQSEGGRYVNSAGVRLPYFCHLKNQNMIGRIKELRDDAERCVAFVRTKEDFCNVEGMTRIFLDYSDPLDYLHSVGEQMKQDDLQYLYENADIVLSADPCIMELYSDKVIGLPIRKPYFVYENRLKWGSSHRISSDLIDVVLSVVAHRHFIKNEKSVRTFF